MLKHKVLKRQENVKEFIAAQDAPVTLLTMLCEGLEVERATDLTMSALTRDKTFLAGLLQALNARLHRSLKIGGYVAISRLLAALLEQLPGNALEDALFTLLAMHPDLVPFIAATTAGRSWMTRSLEAWIGMQISSSLVSPERWMALMRQLLKDKTNLHLVPRFVSHLGCTLDKDRLMASYFTVLELMNELREGNHCSSQDPLLSLALVSFCLQMKEIEPTIDCTCVLEHLGELEMDSGCTEASLLLSWLGTHPAWSEEEMFVIFHAFSSPFGALMLLADYPQLSRADREEALEAMTEEWTTRTSVIYTIKLRIPATAHPIVSLLAASLTAPRMELSWPLDNFDYTYCYFVHLSCRLLQERDPSTLLPLVKLAHVHLMLAQRVLFLITLWIKSSTTRRDLVIGVKALLEFARIDDFCQVRATLLLSGLLQISYNVRAVTLPVLAAVLEGNEEHVTPLPFVFDLISEHLASLVHSGNPTAQGARSFAVCVWLLSGAQRRQSHLKLAYSAAHGILRTQAFANQIRELEPQTVALLLASLERLIKAEFVSPKLIWDEVLRPYILCDARFMSDIDLVAQTCAIAGTMSRLVPEHVEDYEKTDPLVFQVITFLTEVLVKGRMAAGALCALVNYPAPFLASFCNVSLVEVFAQMEPEQISDRERMLDFLSQWLRQDISLIPRSLFLGTSKAMSPPSPSVSLERREVLGEHTFRELLSTRCSRWAGNISLAIAHFTIGSAKVSDSLRGDCEAILALPSLILQPWLIRVEFCISLRRYVMKQLLARQDESTILDTIATLELLAKDRISNGLTVASISMAILLWAAIRRASHQINGSTTYQVEQDALHLMSFKMVPERFVQNDEVIASTIFGLSGLSAPHWKERVREAARSWPISDDSWAELALQICIENDDWRRIVLQGDTEVGPINVLSSAGGIDEAIKLSSQLATTEPRACKGMHYFYLGRSLELISNGKEHVLTSAASLASLGSAVRKIETCHLLAGLLRVGCDREQGIASAYGDISSLYDSLETALMNTTDVRLSAWLIVLASRLLGARATPKPAQPISQSNMTRQRACADNRFGLERPFGICLEMLLRGSQYHQDLIIQALERLPTVPVIDWKFLMDRGQLQLSFIWRHLRYQLGGVVRYNEVMVDLLLSFLERDPSSTLLDHTGEQFDWFLAAVQPNRAKSNRVAVAASGLAAEVEEIALQLLSHCDNFDDIIIEGVARTIPMNYTACWKLVAERIPKLHHLQPSYVGLLRTGSVSDALALLYEHPESVITVAKSLDSAQTLPELVSYYYLALSDGGEDAADDCQLIGHLMIETLLQLSHPILRSLSNVESLAWKEYSSRWPRLAESIERRLRPVAALCSPANPLQKILEVICS